MVSRVLHRVHPIKELKTGGSTISDSFPDSGHRVKEHISHPWFYFEPAHLVYGEVRFHYGSTVVRTQEPRAKAAGNSPG